MSNTSTYIEYSDKTIYTELEREYTKIVEINPFRYRGYYYDTETKLYYLNSRYYDPEIGRFINADDVGALDVTKITLNGLNLYSYCLNNPVNEVDENGYIATWLLLIIIGTIVGAVVSTGFEVANQVEFHGWDVKKWDWGQIGLSALGGAISGAISSIPIWGYWGGGAAIFGGIGSVIGGLISGSVNDAKSFFVTLGIGALANVFAKFVTDKIGKLLSNKAEKLLNNPAFSDLTLEDLIGSGLKNNGNSPVYNNLLKSLTKAILYANNYYFKSLLYMFTVTGISSSLSNI